MIAVIGDSAQTPSIELHAAAGFRMVGTFEAVGFKFGRWLDSVLMQKAMGTGATDAAVAADQAVAICRSEKNPRQPKAISPTKTNAMRLPRWLMPMSAMIVC